MTQHSLPRKFCAQRGPMAPSDVTGLNRDEMNFVTHCIEGSMPSVEILSMCRATRLTVFPALYRLFRNCHLNRAAWSHEEDTVHPDHV